MNSYHSWTWYEYGPCSRLHWCATRTCTSNKQSLRFVRLNGGWSIITFCSGGQWVGWGISLGRFATKTLLICDWMVRPKMRSVWVAKSIGNPLPPPPLPPTIANQNKIELSTILQPILQTEPRRQSAPSAQTSTTASASSSSRRS